MLFQSSLAMLGVSVNLFLILTVLLALSQNFGLGLARSDFVDLTRIILSCFVAFAASLGLSVYSSTQVDEGGRGIMTDWSFYAFVAGLTLFGMFALLIGSKLPS